MKIETDEELADAVSRASELLQAITDYTGRKVRPDAVVRFPRGFLRTAADHRERLKFLGDGTLGANLSYTLMMSDVVYWILMRTDLSGMAREMFVKLFVFIGGTLTESITKAYLKGVCGKPYKERTQYLLTLGLIDSTLKQELDWIWDTRNNMHLFLLDESEFMNEYNATAHSRCVAAFKQLVAALTKKGPLPSAG